jgi:hypothetical protein
VTIVLVLYKVPVEKLVTVDLLPLAPTDGEADERVRPEDSDVSSGEGDEATGEELPVEPELPDPDAGEEAIGDETAEETTLPLDPELPEAGIEAAGDEANGEEAATELGLDPDPELPEAGTEAAGEDAATELGLDPETPESVTAEETGADPDP